jgi:hypothetical protein
MTDPTRPPDALMLLTSTCPFCPTVLQGLGELVKAGLIGRLEVVNIERHPETARALGVRAVPWVRLGPFELDGLRSAAELRYWAERAGTPEGLTEYLHEQFATGGLHKVIELVRRDPAWLDALPRLVADPETSVHVRVGIGALIEEMQGRRELARLVEPLAALTQNDDARTRSDASHYLGLIGDRQAIPYIERLLDDPDATVRSIAAESLAALRKL